TLHEVRFRYPERPRFRGPFFALSGDLPGDPSGNLPDRSRPFDFLGQLVQVSGRDERLGGDAVEETEELVDPDGVELALHVVEQEHRVAAALDPVQLDLRA